MNDRAQLESVADSAVLANYVRQARRLRHRLRHAPVRLHRSLRALRPATSTTNMAAAGPNDRFAESVVRAIEGGTLRYSRRQKLLREANRLGIERFEANLIIAVVQHKLRGNAAAAEAATQRSYAPWIAFAVVQVSILLGAAALWFNLK